MLQQGLTPEQLQFLLSNKQSALASLDRLQSANKLLDYITLYWDCLEPGRKFINGWAVGAICEHLQAVTDGQIRRLLMNVPPGCMKSLTTNVFWPSWEWGPRNRPDMRYVCASYSEALTIRDNRRCRSLIQSERYQRAFGHRYALASDQSAKVRFDTDKTGFKIATSVGGLGTGERGDRFIIDDPHNVKDSESDVIRDSTLQWFTEVVPTRIIDAKSSAIVVIMQRVHERDVSGHILAKELNYDLLCLPMEYEPDHPHKSHSIINFVDPRIEPGTLLWPERFPKDYLDGELKPVLSSWGGNYAIAGQLQQRPAPRGGGMFKKKDFKVVGSKDVPQNLIRVRGWDLAATKDGGAFTACCKGGLSNRGDVYILDVDRIQGSPLDVENMILDCATKDGTSVIQDLPQDPGQAGVSQKSAILHLLHGFTAWFSPESGSKEDRAKPLAAQVEGGNVYLVQAEWNDAFLNEACVFPNGVYKDQIDAASRMYAALLRLKGTSRSVAAPELIGIDNGGETEGEQGDYY